MCLNVPQPINSPFHHRIGGGGGDGLAKALDLRMQELILSNRMVGAKGDGDDEGDSSLSGEAVRNTNDRRTDPNTSCICERASERERERERERVLGLLGFQYVGKWEETR
jgi:hypothetical protein